MEQQVKNLFAQTFAGWTVEYFVTLNPDKKYRIVATFEGENEDGPFADRQVFTAEVKRDVNGLYLFVDKF